MAFAVTGHGTDGSKFPVFQQRRRNMDIVIERRLAASAGLNEAKLGEAMIDMKISGGFIRKTLLFGKALCTRPGKQDRTSLFENASGESHRISTRLTPAIAPAFNIVPSMTDASISWVASAV